MKLTIPVVIVGGSLNGLGVVRSLAVGRMPIFVLETSILCPCAWSRLCRFVRVVSLEGRPLIEGLKDLASRIGQRAVLILTDDRAVETVSTYRNEIQPWFYFSLPSKEVVTQLANKGQFHQLAEREGLPVPRSLILDDVNDLRALQALHMPLVFKPTNKALALNGQVSRAVYVHTVQQANLVASTMLRNAGSLIVQEWIDGPDTEIFFTLFTCDRNSNIVALFHGRKVVCDPPGVGNTALCVQAVESAQELERLTKKFISLVGFQGLGSLEFKRDRRNHRFLIIEPTVGRTDWQEEVATLCGVNIPLTAYLTELNQQINKVPSEFSPIAWCSSIRYKAPAGELLVNTKIRGGYFLFSDPMPAFYYYGYERFIGRIWSLIKKISRYLMGFSSVQFDNASDTTQQD